MSVNSSNSSLHTPPDSPRSVSSGNSLHDEPLHDAQDLSAPLLTATDAPRPRAKAEIDLRLKELQGKVEEFENKRLSFLEGFLISCTIVGLLYTIPKAISDYFKGEDLFVGHARGVFGKETETLEKVRTRDLKGKLEKLGSFEKEAGALDDRVSHLENSFKVCGMATLRVKKREIAALEKELNKLVDAVKTNSVDVEELTSQIEKMNAKLQLWKSLLQQEEEMELDVKSIDFAKIDRQHPPENRKQWIEAKRKELQLNPFGIPAKELQKSLEKLQFKLECFTEDMEKQPDFLLWTGEADAQLGRLKVALTDAEAQENFRGKSLDPLATVSPSKRMQIQLLRDDAGFTKKMQTEIDLFVKEARKAQGGAHFSDETVVLAKAILPGRIRRLDE